MTLSIKQVPGPKQHWLKGNIGQFNKTKIHEYFYETARTFGGTARIRFFNRSLIIFQKPQTVQELLKARPERYRRAKVVESIFAEMGIHGVFASEGDNWKKQRYLMNPAFRPSQVREFFPTISNITGRLCSKLSSSPNSVDVQDVLMSYTVDITSTLAFGCDVNTLADSNTVLQKNLNVIFPMISFRLRSPFPYWRFFKLSRDRDLDSALVIVNQHVKEFIDNARHKIESRGCVDVDSAENLLEAMILSRGDANETFTEEEISSNVITLLLAGEDTTANTIAWAFDFLADRPELQSEIFSEIDANYQKSKLEIDDLSDFPLIAGVIHETLRLKPVAPHVYLEPIYDETIENVFMPAGTLIVALLSGDSFNEALFPSSMQFDPKRWLNIPEEIRKKYASTLMPFGFGPRLCPGRQLSLIEMKICLIEVLKRFRLKRSEGSVKAETALKFTIQPVNLRIDFLAR